VSETGTARPPRELGSPRASRVTRSVIFANVLAPKDSRASSLGHRTSPHTQTTSRPPRDAATLGITAISEHREREANSEQVHDFHCRVRERERFRALLRELPAISERLLAGLAAQLREAGGEALIRRDRAPLEASYL
jgi:hypothetical protein